MMNPQSKPEVSDSLVEKIKNLLAKAESAKSIGNQAEAEAFAQGAMRLMEKYNIDAAEIRQRSGSKIQMRYYAMPLAPLLQRHESNWVEILIHVLAKYNLCQAVNCENGDGYGNHGHIMAIMGQPHNVDMVVFMGEQLVSRARGLARSAFKTYDGMEKRNTFIRGYLRGFANGIGLKLKEEYDRSIAHDQIGSGNHENQFALVVTNNQVALRSFTEQKFPRLAKGSSSRLSGTSGYSTGLAAGKSASIHRGVTGSSNNRRLN